ncbi:rCG28852, partial [Rattus norvegicus]
MSVLQDPLDLREFLAQWAFQEVEDHLESKVIRAPLGHQDHQGLEESRDLQ